MNLHLLRTFFAVVQHGSFSRAADAIHVSQPAVSKAVRELETQLDMPLIERSGSQLRLTEAGAALHEHARAIFALEQAAESDMRARRGLDHGQLTIGASTTIATYLLPPVLARFVNRYPGVELRVISDNTKAIESRLLAYELDVAFVEGPVHDPRVEIIHWRDDELVVLASANHPLPDGERTRLAELSQQRWLIRETGSGTQAVTTRLLQEAGVDVRRVLEVSSTAAMIQGVVAGLGLAMVSIEAARDQLEAGKVKIVNCPGTTFTRPLHRINLRHRPRSPAATAFDALSEA